MRSLFSYVQAQSPRVSSHHSVRPGELHAVVRCQNRWKPDNMARKCDSPTCGIKFNIVERKHHCRVCGNVFCQACSSRYIPLHINSLPTTLSSLPTMSLSMDDFPDPPTNHRVCDGCYALIYGSQDPSPSTTDQDPPSLFEPPVHGNSSPLFAQPRPSGTSSFVSPGYARIRRGSAQQTSSTISSFQSAYFYSNQSTSGGSLSSTPSALGILPLNHQRGTSVSRREINSESDPWLPRQLRVGSRPNYRPVWDHFSAELDEDAVSVPPSETKFDGANKDPTATNPHQSPAETGELVQSEHTIKGDALAHKFPDIPVTISGAMPTADILAHLGKHGCSEVTNQVDLSKSSDYPVVAGGFGDIYRGALYDGTQVSIKCLRLMIDSGTTGRKHVKRAAHELYVWSKCNHPNVLEVYGVARYRDQIAMVSPWMENGNLSQFLARQPQIDRCVLCVQVANGTAYLHSQGIAHGDIKGANVLVARDCTLKLTDFGNASLKEYSLQFTTTANTLNISPRWTAPEIVFGDAGHSVEADVYAVGMTILEILTGAVPYAGFSDVTVFAKVMNNIHPSRPEHCIPSGSSQADFLWMLLMTCWARSPRDRPSAANVGDQMQMFTQEGLLKSNTHWIPYSVLELSTS
ncbi:tyrosine kinase catalytic domain protein [Rhizoctonia solani 123E]|uniref:Tyrosine kinase catalytic domain protein n=1 Tax=Rhizoctonia solani 123E TaxID=1423351 RepID=A0A074RKE4_9AGAM|nr:tyrosine kinase catalytic domain protein [Rhizoctonia solani 123E]